MDRPGQTISRQVSGCATGGGRFGKDGEDSLDTESKPVPLRGSRVRYPVHRTRPSRDETPGYVAESLSKNDTG